jgi:hypothetical protein
MCKFLIILIIMFCYSCTDRYVVNYPIYSEQDTTICVDGEIEVKENISSGGSIKIKSKE